MHAADNNNRANTPARQTVLEMIKLQRRIFEKQRKAIEAAEFHLTPGFSRYRNAYLHAVSEYESVSGFGALCDAIADARLAYVADYHTSRLAQRTFVKIIRGVMQQVENIVFCLEFVPIEYQDPLDRYLLGKISERTFLRRIHYKEHWPYDIWPNFRPIFDLAIDHGIPIIAIDGDPSLSLSKRDQIAAKRIFKTLKLNLHSTVFVFTGQMHIVPSHLPAAVERLFSKSALIPPKKIIVYQNAEEIYWRLAEERLEGAEIVKISDDSYCVNNTPPLVQQLSYLHWINYDEELLEYTELQNTVKTIIRTLGKFLKVPFQTSIRMLRVLTPGDLDLMQCIEDGLLTDTEKEQILSSVESDESACIPSLRAIYLSTLSLNHAAEEASHFLKQHVSGAIVPAGIKDRFYFYILNEACGFFGSKIMNPKRKTEHQGKLRSIVAAARKRKGKRTPFEKAAEFSLAHINFEVQKSNLKRRTFTLITDPKVFNAAAHILGYILGDRLYYSLTSGLVSKSTVRDLFLSPFDGPGESLKLYLSLKEKVSNVSIPNRI